MKTYNFYYILGGQQSRLYAVPRDRVEMWTLAILDTGGEITGIIDTDKDG